MPSYDEDLPTQQEEFLLKQLEQNHDEHQRLQTIVELKNRLAGSRRSKSVFYRSSGLEIIVNLLKEYSLTNTNSILIPLIDCISSFTKSNNEEIVNHLVECGCLELLFKILSIENGSIDLYEATLRCLRSFFLPTLSDRMVNKMDYSNPYIVPVPFILLCEQENQPFSPVLTSTTSGGTQRKFKQISIVETLFSQNLYVDTLIRLLSISKVAQAIIIEIFSCLCIDNERQQALMERNISSILIQILVQNIHEKQQQEFQIDRINVINLTNDFIIGIILKFFSSLCYENPSIGQRLHQMIHPETNQTLIEIVSNLLNNIYRPAVLSYYAAKFFVNLCKCKILAADHPSVALESLPTLIHLCSKSILNKCLYLYIECLETLIYLLNGNSQLHHLAIYNEQFLNRLFTYFFTPTKIVDETIDESISIKIRASALTLLAVLASHHEDIKKRIAEHDNLISKAIECCRSQESHLQIAAFRLFHALSRSVSQLRTTFNDPICDILLETVQSSDLPLVKICSCVISNVILEFSTCRPKLLNGGILNVIITFLDHSDHDVRINSIWALRNLSYLAGLKVKQEIINGFTIERIYKLLDECLDEQFLLCLVSLLRNLFDEKDTDALLPIFNSMKLMASFQKILDRKMPEKIHHELKLLINHLNGALNPIQSRVSTESVNSTCRTSFFPEYACEEMDQLDCS